MRVGSFEFRDLLAPEQVGSALRLAWDLLVYVVSLHVAWIAAWLLIVCANGGVSPHCGEQCQVAVRFKEALPWQTPDTLFFYVGLYLLLLVYAYYRAATHWLRGTMSTTTRSLRIVAIVFLVPAFLNHAFWKVVIETYANVHYVDWDRTHAQRDHERLRPPTLPLHNGSEIALHPDDVVIVGNGPLSPEHRAFVRASRPTQLYRFNGMTNLLPDEPVGHLFVRRVTETFDIALREFPSDYWGLAPPLRKRGIVEWLYVPASSVVRERTMCHRAPEAVDITLLNGMSDDVGFYTWHYGVEFRLPECDGLCREAPPSAGGTKAPGGWTSGFLGLLEVLDIKPNARVHLLGMNFGAAPNQQHATHVERRFVQMLVDRGRVMMHRPPSGTYHSEFRPRLDGKHLGFPTNLFATDMRIQGMRCGEWNPWWFPEWQWSPQRWSGAVPLPPFFHPGTELHVADAEGNTLPSNYDPLNCTQHAELLAKKRGGRNGRRLSSRLSLRRFVKVHTGIKLYGGPLASNVSMSLESLEECEARVALVRKYEGDFAARSSSEPRAPKPEHHGSHGGTKSSSSGGGGKGGHGGAKSSTTSSTTSKDGGGGGGGGDSGSPRRASDLPPPGGGSGKHASGVAPSVNTTQAHSKEKGSRRSK